MELNLEEELCNNVKHRSAMSDRNGQLYIIGTITMTRILRSRIRPKLARKLSHVWSIAERKELDKPLRLYGRIT